MPETYFIVLASNDRWVWSSSELDTFESAGEYRSPFEALDALRSNLISRGLVVGELTSHGGGFAVEARSKSEVADRPMFYAASALEYIDDVKDRLGEQLRDLALRKVREEGRTTVTHDDIIAVLAHFDATFLREGNLATR